MKTASNVIQFPSTSRSSAPSCTSFKLHGKTIKQSFPRVLLPVDSVIVNMATGFYQFHELMCNHINKTTDKEFGYLNF